MPYLNGSGKLKRGKTKLLSNDKRPCHQAIMHPASMLKKIADKRIIGCFDVFNAITITKKVKPKSRFSVESKSSTLNPPVKSITATFTNIMPIVVIKTPVVRGGNSL